jgi:glyoxylase-like metal-dependent hydrolase (beta-lactamase superfamily II)
LRQNIHNLPTSKHFTLHQVAVGVYAAIGIEGGAAYSNAGIIDLGEQTLIFDTFETPIAAQDLKAAAEQLTGRPASGVIISHAHDDHWLGNQVFAEQTPIITTHEIRDLMLEISMEIKEMKENPIEVKKMIQEHETRLRAEKDERQRLAIQHSLSRLRYTLEILPNLELRLPNLTFEGKLVFHGVQRKVELFTLGKGHTASDCFLVLPEDKIVFMGDLGFFQCQPFMAYSDPEAWVAQLEQMERSEIETFVPGHGPLGSKADLAIQRQYIYTIEQLVAQVIKEGSSEKDALKVSLPRQFQNWLVGGKGRFETNIRSSFKRQSNKGES